MTSYHLRATLLPDGDEPMDLWVHDGRFTFTPVTGAEELGRPGMFALPGLADCHAHVSLDMAEQVLPPGALGLIESNLRAHLASGTLLVRDPGSPDGSSAAWQGRPGLPRLQAAGRFLAPEGRYVAFGQWTAPGQLAASAAAHVASGARWAKVVVDWVTYDGPAAPARFTPNYDAATIRGAVEAVHAAGGRVTVHTTGPEGAANAVAAGVDGIEHGDGLDEELLSHCAAKGIAWCPTLAMTEVAAEMIERTGEARRRFAHERYEAARYLLPIAERLGVTVLAGTDMLPHGSVALEVETLARHGLSPRAALAAASTAARRYLGEPGIEEGAPADLVLYAADPRTTPEVLRSPSLVMLEGEIVARSRAEGIR